MAATLATLEDERRQARQAAENMARDRQMEERLAEARLQQADTFRAEDDNCRVPAVIP
jgi:hypothetical protein